MYKLEKRIKIGRIIRYNFTSFRPYVAPVFKISGYWFRSFGFKSGEYVKVIATKEHISIKPIKL